jgi:foldase protein PrsA
LIAFPLAFQGDIVPALKIFAPLLLLALLLAACGGSPAPTDAQIAPTVAVTPPTLPPPTQPPTPAAFSAEGEPLAARVNAVDITLAAFEARLERDRRFQAQIADESAYRATILDQMIEQVIIEQAAAAQNITVTQADIDARIEEYIGLAGSPEAWQQQLEAMQYSEVEVRQIEANGLLYGRVRDAVTADIGATVQQANARHIVVETRERAEEVLTRLGAGEDFAALAAVYSLDVTTRESGGDLGWFTREGLLQPTLTEIIFSLEPGASAGPIETSIGFHVVQLLEIGDRPLTDESRAALAQARFEAWLAEQVANARIERFI